MIPSRLNLLPHSHLQLLRCRLDLLLHCHLQLLRCHVNLCHVNLLLHCHLQPCLLQLLFHYHLKLLLVPPRRLATRRKLGGSSRKLWLHGDVMM